VELTERKYLKYVRIADLPEHYQDAIKAIGIVATFKLCEAFPGIPLYFKNIDRLLYPAKSAYIIDNFTGDNHRRLAIDSCLPLASVYDILKKHHEKKTAINAPGIGHQKKGLIIKGESGHEQ
jgi:Mor family transcriptional regulator